MKLIVLCSSYEANTAFANRVNALIKGIAESGLDVEAYFISDKPVNIKFKGLDNIYVRNLSSSSKYPRLKSLISLYEVFRFARKLPNGSRLLTVGCDFYLPAILNKNISIYHERTEHPDVSRSYPPYWHGLYLRSLKRLTGMFVISTSLKNYFQGLGIKNISIINMIVDAGRFENVVRNIGKDKYIAFCGNGSNNKDGVDILIKSFKQIADKYPDLRLKIIGPAPKDNAKESNKTLVNDLQLGERVVFTGVIPAEQIPQLLVDAELLALARPDSLQAQCGFPTKLGEYLLSGRPVAVTNVGDIPLFLEHKKNAMIAKQGDVDDFAQCMLWLLEHPIESERIGEEGKKVAMADFNYLTEAKKIVKELKKTV